MTLLEEALPLERGIASPFVGEYGLGLSNVEYEARTGFATAPRISEKGTYQRKAATRSRLPFPTTTAARRRAQKSSGTG